MLSWNALFIDPYGIRFHEKVEDGEELAHAGDDRNFGFLAKRFQALIERLDRRVMADRTFGETLFRG
ncbi:hypothetical protein D3C83_308100 [compost metagenome]